MMRTFCLLVAAALVTRLGAQAPTPIISEFQASNDSTIADQDGDYADWLEVYNPGPGPAVLDGWYLSDKASKPTKWQFPAGVTLPAGGYLVVFCSEKNYTNPAQPLATSFNLSASSGYVGLTEPDKKTVASSYTYGVQYTDVSYGVSQPTDGSAPQTGYLATATPGAANGGTGNILLADMTAMSPQPQFFTGNLSLAISGATGGEHIRYLLQTPAPAGDLSQPPTSASPLYAQPMSIGATTLVNAAVFASDDSQRGMNLAGMYVQLDNSTANRVDTFSSSLPVLVFDDNGFGLLPDDDAYYPGWIASFSPQGGKPTTLTQAPDFFTPGTLKLHGFSSATFLKQSYDIDLADQLGNDLSEPFLGMDSSKSWDAIGPWYYDRTFIRNAFVYSLSNSMGHWAASTRFAEAFIHSGGGPLGYDSYAGVTTLTDRIKVDADRVNIYSIDTDDITAPNVTGGYIIRVDHPESDLYQWTTTAGFPVMIDTPKLDVISQPQVSYVTSYVQQMENAMYADQASGWATRNYLSYLDRPSWVDYHLITTFTENVDEFLYSEYFTKDVNGPIVAGPVWDYDRSMGSADGRDVNPQTWTANNNDSVWTVGWWGVLASDPDFMQAWIDRWAFLRGFAFSDARLGQLITSLSSGVGSAAAARDIARWPDDAGRFGDGSWQGEVDHLQDWVTTRAHWIDMQFEAAPSVLVSGQSRVLTPQSDTQLAYTTDGSDPRLSGGAMSASAVVSSAPVTLPSSQAYTARTYDTRMASAFPGS
ncbi:MAG TPA: CotH kinase family protein, partial [Opitutaceae bacterium]